MPVVYDLYGLSDGKKVTVKVVVGYAQMGDVLVYLGAKEVAHAPGVDPPLVLGDASNLRGQRVVVQAAVLDIRSETDQTSVEVVLTGGSEPMVISKAQTAVGGKPVPYFYSIDLV